MERQEQAFWCTVEEEQVEDPIEEQKQPEEAVTPEKGEVESWWEKYRSMPEFKAVETGRRAGPGGG